MENKNKNNNRNKIERQGEEQDPKNWRIKEAMKGAWDLVRNNWKKSTAVIGTTAVLSVGANAQGVNRGAERVLNEKQKTEANAGITVKMPDGSTKSFPSVEELEIFMNKGGLVYTGNSAEKNTNLNKNKNQNNNQDTGPGQKNLENKPVMGFRLYSRDYRVSEKFRSMPELENFAKSKNTLLETRYIALIYTDGTEQKLKEMQNVSLDDLRKINVVNNGGGVPNQPNQPNWQNQNNTSLENNNSNTVNLLDFLNTVSNTRGKTKVVLRDKSGNSVEYTIDVKQKKLPRGTIINVE